MDTKLLFGSRKFASSVGGAAANPRAPHQLLKIPAKSRDTHIIRPDDLHSGWGDTSTTPKGFRRPTWSLQTLFSFPVVPVLNFFHPVSVTASSWKLLQGRFLMFKVPIPYLPEGDLWAAFTRCCTTDKLWEFPSSFEDVSTSSSAVSACSSYWKSLRDTAHRSRLIKGE